MVVIQAASREPPRRDDAGDAAGRARGRCSRENAGVDREEVDALGGLFLAGGQDVVVGSSSMGGR